MPWPQSEQEQAANVYNRNKGWAVDHPTYMTTLSPEEETQFRNWVKQNNVPFQPDEARQDYDMRGFYKGLQTKDERAVGRINSSDNSYHYPDTWKTPYHHSFSNESIYATKNAPSWVRDEENKAWHLQTQNGEKLITEQDQ